MDETRRDFLKLAAAAMAGTLVQERALAQGAASIESGDRVYITNEDSNTIAVIDPRSNTVDTTINDSFTDWNIKQSGRSPLLSFDQDSNEARGEFGSFRVSNLYSSL